MDCFDRHRWSPILYSGAEEINRALERLGAKGKKIKRINTIGVAWEMEPQEAETAMRRRLAKAGVPYEAIDSGEYRFCDKTLMPCEVRLCEPVVIVFEDETTLELLPNGQDGLWMAADQIPPHMCNGTNRRNYSPAALFYAVRGSKLKEAEVIRVQATSQFGGDYVPLGQGGGAERELCLQALRARVGGVRLR